MSSHHVVRSRKRKLEEKEEKEEPKSKYPVPDELLLLLAKTKAVDLDLGKRDMITCHRSDLLYEALKKLNQHNLLSLPVLTKTDHFWGFIDILDIVKFMVDLIGENVLKKEDFDMDKLEDFRKATVSDIMTHPVRAFNPFHPIEDTHSLLSAVEILSSGVHRVPVINIDKHELVNVISQSAVAKFIDHHKETLGSKRKMVVREMSAVTRFVITIYESEKAIDAFKLMRICKVTGIAVINHKGKLVGNISAHDLKRIQSTARWISRLFQPIKTWIQGEVVSVKNGDTLENVLDSLVLHKIHRVYVINNHGEPMGVVSLTDVLHELLTED